MRPERGIQRDLHVILGEGRRPIAVGLEVEPYPSRITGLYRERDVNGVHDSTKRLRGRYFKAIGAGGQRQVPYGKIDRKIAARRPDALVPEDLGSTEHDSFTHSRDDPPFEIEPELLNGSAIHYHFEGSLRSLLLDDAEQPGPHDGYTLDGDGVEVFSQSKDIAGRSAGREVLVDDLVDLAHFTSRPADSRTQ